jgi:hypothetical protein
MMEQALNNGQQQNALELAQLAPVELKALLSPFLGGQWQNNTPTLRIPYYRPLEPLRRAFYPDAPSSIWPGRFFRPDALRRAQYADRRFSASLAGIAGRPALAVLYPLHAVLAQWRSDRNAQLRQRLLMCWSCPPCGPCSPASAESMSLTPSV